MQEFVKSEEIDVDINAMNEILDATQYPYEIEAKDLNLRQSIIRDSDLMQVYEYNWIHQNIGGLSSELKMDFIEFLKPQRKFLENAEFNSEWGKNLKKERWDDVMRQFKMLEDAFRSLGILEDDDPAHVARTVLEVDVFPRKKGSSSNDASGAQGDAPNEDQLEVTIIPYVR